jgi:hypothetical protein
MENTDYKDIFKKACLLQVSTSVWQCSKVLNQSVLAERTGREVEDMTWLRGRKYLINTELLGPVKTAVQQTFNMIRKASLPFPITGISMIPKDSLSQVDEQLQRFQTRFWSKVDDFEELYEVARDEARGVLKELFDESEYPSRIRSKFNFEWRYLALGVPTRTTILTPAIYEREKEKFQKLMDETRELAVTALREEFSEIVTHLVERLDSNSNGRGKTISNNMFNKLNQFIDDLGSKNLFGDAELTELAEQAKAAIRGVNPSGVKYSDTIRERVSNQMENIKTIIDASIEDMPRRKLRLEPPPPFEMPLPMAMAG